MAERVMTYRRLGDSGLVVSSVGVGCNAFGPRADAAASREVVGAALDAGITLFDTAEMYGTEPGGSEEMLGAALRGRRDEAVVATKFGHPSDGAGRPAWAACGSRTEVRRAVHGSLRRLGTDYIDLVQMHAPDEQTPVAETLAALHELVAEGLVRYVGSSNFSAWQVVDADWTARTEGLTPFVSAQNHYNLLERDAEDDLLPACEHVGVGLLPYFPLQYGLLTGKYRRDEAAPPGSRLASAAQERRLADADWDTIEALEEFARQRSLSMLDVAIGGLAAQPGVGSVIAGATSAEQVRANAAAGGWVPDAADLAALDDITDA